MGNDKTNKTVIQHFFQAVRAGTLDSREFVSPEVVWTVIMEHAPQTTAFIPWAGVHKNLEGLQRFFDLLLANLEVLELETHDFVAEGDLVAAFGYFRYRALSTGKIFESDWAAKVTFHDGKITRFHFFENSLAVAYAFRHDGQWDIENGGKRRRVPSESEG